MNTIIAAAVGGLSSRGSDSMNVKQGANQLPFSKAINKHVGAVYAIELNPVTKVQIQDQGSTNNFIVVSHYGPCPEVPDGHDMPTLTPFSTSQMRDDFDLPIAGAPSREQAGNMMQLSAGNPVNIGTLSTSPDGVTSPAIPNSGDVTPGTAGSNPAAYLTGPVTKQHPWITDVVMIWGLDQLAYGDYDYTDPAGTVHPSLGKGDTKVKKPGLSPRRATNTTELYAGQVTLPGSSPTQYLHSGLRRANDTGGNDGIGVLTQWGTNIDKDDAVDVWLAASTTKPTDGEGDQTARALPCYDGDVYNTSALGEDGGDDGHALYVKLDGKSTSQTAEGKVRSHAIKVTHALPPTDDDIPATAEDGALIDATTDDSLWMRSSGALVRVSLPTGGVTGDKLIKLSDADYDTGWGGAGCLCLDMTTLISIIGSVSGAGGGTPSTGIVYSAIDTFAGSPAAAFDGDDSTGWGSNTRGPGPWLQVDFGVPVTLHRSRIYQPSFGTQHMDAYEIEAGPNGSTWTVLASSTPTAAEDIVTFTPATYRYWRMLCTAESSSYGTAIGSWNLS